MKGLKAVEATRKEYHKDPNLNSVHRSSLLVPEIPGTKAEISFLNHFLLKRNHKKVACIITPIDFEGKKIESRLFHIEQPKVYKFTLSGLVKESVSNYIVEFYSVDNLFIPFPAVMVNHVGNGFVNQVHSFNRMLNSVFENDDVNKHQVSESSIDLILNDDTDTCLFFTAGPLRCNDSLQIDVLTQEKNYQSNVKLDLPRFGTKTISMKETFNDLPNGINGVMKVLQPTQFLFYGRMLSGQWKKDGSFSANHSYYDSSTVEEYWDDDRPSERFSPFFQNFNNSLRVYPIASPSELEFFIKPTSKDGTVLDEISVGTLISPSSKFLDININSITSNSGINPLEIKTCGLIAKAKNNKMPTRIAYQIVYGLGGLESSIQVVLNNPNVFVPKNRNSFKWGQTIIGDGFDSLVGIVSDPSQNAEIQKQDFKVEFYSTKGKLAERNWSLPNGSATTFKVKDELKNELGAFDENNLEYLWCTVEGEKNGLNYYSIAFNENTKYCSGDHGF